MIKLKTLIENNISEFVEGFDLPKFLNMSSFRQQVTYANSNLKKIASGSARIVYEIDDYKVLKLAKNAKGMAQNETESGYFVNDEYGEIIARVLENDDDYRWVVSERAKKITPSEFKKFVGVDIYTFFDYIKSIHGNGWHNKIRLTPEVLKILDSDTNDFAREVLDLLGNTDISWGDFGRISTYGKIEDRVVIIDYGLTDAIYKEFYRR